MLEFKKNSLASGRTKIFLFIEWASGDGWKLGRIY